MTIVAPDVCTCGRGMVVPMKKEGRTRRRKGGGRMVIPASIEIPTCTECGAEWIDGPSARALAALDK